MKCFHDFCPGENVNIVDTSTNNGDSVFWSGLSEQDRSGEAKSLTHKLPEKAELTI